MAFQKGNIAVGQLADLEEKTSSKRSTIRDDLRSMQQQLNAACLREIEYISLLKECKRQLDYIYEGNPAGDMTELLEKLGGVLNGLA